MLCLSACGEDKNIEAEAMKIVEAINNKDMYSLEIFVFGVENTVVDEAVAEFFCDSENDEKGIIYKIIEKETIEISEVTDEHIVYEITAPDLSDVFNEIIKTENLTADSFKEYFYSYIVTAGMVKTKVEIPYTYKEEVFTADYSTPDFLNSITGNLITAYQNLIQQMLQENSVEETE